MESPEEQREYDRQVDVLFNKLYKDPSSGVFLDSNLERIYQAARRDARLVPIDRGTIYRYKRTLEQFSRQRERRAIGSRRRHESYRQWKIWGPNNVLACR